MAIICVTLLSISSGVYMEDSAPAAASQFTSSQFHRQVWPLNQFYYLPLALTHQDIIKNRKMETPPGVIYILKFGRFWNSQQNEIEFVVVPDSMSYLRDGCNRFTSLCSQSPRGSKIFGKVSIMMDFPSKYLARPQTTVNLTYFPHRCYTGLATKSIFSAVFCSKKKWPLIMENIIFRSSHQLPRLWTFKGLC